MIGEDSFTERVKKIVRSISRGETRTYAQIAGAAGSPKGARAVANIMAKNFDPTVPCHRVICSNGTVGGYNRGGEVVKRSILLEEGAL